VPLPPARDGSFHLSHDALAEGNDPGAKGRMTGAAASRAC
jgi:hypothetical protein